MNRSSRPEHARLSAIGAAVCMVLAHGPANAQQAQRSAPADANSASNASELETIVVTARRREESLFNVPVSVTPVSGETLSAAGLTSIGDIVALVPNAHLTTNPRGFDTYISIRGMTQSDSNAEPNFGAYRNGIFNGGHRVNLGPQLDVERVEVLKGPQGGLYGRDAVGGAINVVYAMPKPGDELNGYATLDVGTCRVRGSRVPSRCPSATGSRCAPRAGTWTRARATTVTSRSTSGWTGKTTRRPLEPGGGACALGELRDDRRVRGARRAVTAHVFARRVPNGGFAPAGVPPSCRPRKRPRRCSATPTRGSAWITCFASAKLTYTTDAGALTLQAAYQDYNEDMVLDQDHTALQPDAGLLVLKQEGFWNNSVQHYFLEGLWESDQDQRFGVAGRPVLLQRGVQSRRNLQRRPPDGVSGADRSSGPGVITGYVGLPLPAPK